MRWSALLASVLLALPALPARADTPLTLVLNWVPGADHAPFYFALRQGWYAQAGIALTIESVAGSPEAVKRAAGGGATLAVAEFVSYLRARAGLADTTAVMVLQPRSPYAIYFSAAAGIEAAQSLAGRRVAAQAQEPMRRLWGPLARRNGVSGPPPVWIERSNAAKPDALVEGEADAAFNPFLHNHLNYAAALGPAMGVLWWHDLGFAAYGHVLVAGGALLDHTPGLAGRFVAATQRAWAQCLAEAAPCIDALLLEHPQLDRAREQAVWELAAQLFAAPGAPAPLGAFDPARVQRTLDDLEAAFGPQTGGDRAVDNGFLDPQVHAPR